ncbi:hypothetical protein CEXT_594881 [Caerostris extrusa]|uniref:Uncharacterized protein n=1 Tax=Caerostris extrusa TaxID=172846 RepID=A0AAV4W9K1_CAEEX|nr:hypothetical protein CEXT_594881 [Caerostris extrusa]
MQTRATRLPYGIIRVLYLYAPESESEEGQIVVPEHKRTLILQEQYNTPNLLNSTLETKNDNVTLHPVNNAAKGRNAELFIVIDSMSYYHKDQPLTMKLQV